MKEEKRLKKNGLSKREKDTTYNGGVKKKVRLAPGKGGGKMNEGVALWRRSLKEEGRKKKKKKKNSIKVSLGCVLIPI